jgi:hypothetical protein
MGLSGDTKRRWNTKKLSLGITVNGLLSMNRSTQVSNPLVDAEFGTPIRLTTSQRSFPHSFSHENPGLSILSFDFFRWNRIWEPEGSGREGRP